jgi:L-threonylcarbamoyladenylate synthase
VLHQDGVIAMATESVYALGACVWSATAVRRVCAIKRRPDGKPILVLVGDRTQLTPLVLEVTPAASILIERFWPGPLTLVLRAASELTEALTASSGTVGVRQTAWPPLVRLLRYVGPLTGTSANRSGEPPARTAEEVQRALGAELDLILDGGPAPGVTPSTIVDAVGPVRLLREGPISRRQIETVLAPAGVALAAS